MDSRNILKHLGAGFMNDSMETIILEREALRLPESQRALLADRLLQSLETGGSNSEAAWATEVEARFEAYERGKLAAVDGPEAVRRIRDGLR
jgi:putative addiction module component (TIGR02574 family)